MPKKRSQLNYEKIDRVTRWNYCQLIAKYILDSSLSDDELKDVLVELQNSNRRLIIDVK
jgi:hypothetical protein